jgi:hypothetical protein
MDGECPVKVLMIAKVVDLESVFGVGQGTGALLQNAVDDVFVRIPQLLAGICDAQKPAAVDSTLTMDVYCFRLRVLEE